MSNQEVVKNEEAFALRTTGDPTDELRELYDTGFSRGQGESIEDDKAQAERIEASRQVPADKLREEEYAKEATHILEK